MLTHWRPEAGRLYGHPLGPGFSRDQGPGRWVRKSPVGSVTSTSDSTKADRVYFPAELLQGKAGMATPDGFKVGDMTYYAAPSRIYQFESEAGEVRFRDSYYGGEHEGLQVEFNAKPNQPLYIRCRGGEIAFLTKAEAMKGLATMKYDMPKPRSKLPWWLPSSLRHDTSRDSFSALGTREFHLYTSRRWPILITKITSRRSSMVYKMR